MPEHEYDAAFLIIAGKDALDPALAHFIIRTAMGTTDGPIIATIDGYNDDPRDLWEIPECIEFLQALGARLSEQERARLDEEFRNLLTVVSHEDWKILRHGDGVVFMRPKSH